MTKRMAYLVVAAALAIPLAVWAAQARSSLEGSQGMTRGEGVVLTAMDAGSMPREWNSGQGGSGQGGSGQGGKMSELRDGGWREMARDAGGRLMHRDGGGMGGSGNMTNPDDATE